MDVSPTTPSASSNAVTRLEDARALRRMGLPLNTPVEDGGELPKRSTDLIGSIHKAASSCRSAVYAYVANQNASTYAKLKRAHAKLGRELAKVPMPKWVDEPDGSRTLTNPFDVVVGATALPRCLRAYNLWATIIATLERGETVDIHVTDAADVWPTDFKKPEGRS